MPVRYGPDAAKKNDDYSARERLAEWDAFGRSVFWFQLLLMTVGVAVVSWTAWSVNESPAPGRAMAMAGHNMDTERLFLRFVIAPVYWIAYVVTLVFRRERKITIFTLLFSNGVACYALGFSTLLAFKEAVGSHAAQFHSE